MEWPWPVPLSALEASAWRALEFGLLPGRARVAVVDPVSGEAGVVDREFGRLAGVGGHWRSAGRAATNSWSPSPAACSTRRRAARPSRAC